MAEVQGFIGMQRSDQVATHYVDGDEKNVYHAEHYSNRRWVKDAPMLDETQKRTEHTNTVEYSYKRHE